jgi:hypothetical protein
MRLDTHDIRLFLLQHLEQMASVKEMYDDGDLLIIHLASGEKAIIYFVERSLNIDDIRDTYETNARDGIHTMYLIWAEMFLGEPDEAFEPADWLAMLHDINNGRLYAFDGNRAEPELFTVTLEPARNPRQRVARYGEDIDIRRLGCATVQGESEHIEGTWYIADFEHPPAEKTSKQRRYRYAGDSRARRGESSHRQAGPENGHSQSQQRPPLLRRPSTHVSYEILGLPLNAPREMVRQRYRDLARVYHPDVNASPEATARMQRINTAYRQIMRNLDYQEKM